MKSEWQEFKLESLARSCAMGPFGSNIKASNFVEQGVPVIRGGNLNFDKYVDGEFVYLTDEKAEQLKSSICYPGDLVFTHRGTIGQVGLVPKGKHERYIISQSGMRLSLDKDKVDVHFLFYFFKSPKGQFELLKNKSQVGVPAISSPLSSLKAIKVKIPELNTQKKIAHILSSLDDKIELNKKINQSLESIAQTLFKSWFVDFDPVHAKANASSEDEYDEIAKELGISREILDLFPSEFEESELGLIPKGWDVIKIEVLLERYRVPKRYKKQHALPYGKIPVFEQGSSLILGYHNSKPDFNASIYAPMFIFGDHTCVMELSVTPFSISENVIPLSGKIRNSYWTYFAVRDMQKFQEYRRHWSELIVKKTLLPPNAVTDYFADIIKYLFIQKEQNKNVSNTLRQILELLLPKLLSGELDVSTLDLDLEND